MWWIVLAGMTALAVTACFVWFFMILSRLMLRVEHLGQSLDLLKADSIQLRAPRKTSAPPTLGKITTS